MRRSKLLAGLGVIAAMLIGAALVIVIASGSGATAADNDPHSGALISGAERGRVLNAVAAATTANSQAELVARGRALFRDPTLFKSGESCQTCHTEGAANPGLGTFHANRPVDPPLVASVTPLQGDRDPPSLWGAGQTAPFFWDARSPDLATTVATTVEDHFKTALTTTDGTTPDDARIAGFTAPLVAYISQLKAPTNSFDEGTMSPSALRGEVVFQGQGGCIACHGGPNFTDNHLHDTCVPRGNGNDAGAPIVTSGPNANAPVGTTLAVLCQSAKDLGGEPLGALINTPQLRDVKDTAPYMHNGAFDTLIAVMQFYNSKSSIAPLNLTNGQMQDLVAYMESL